MEWSGVVKWVLVETLAEGVACLLAWKEQLPEHKGDWAASGVGMMSFKLCGVFLYILGLSIMDIVVYELVWRLGIIYIYFCGFIIFFPEPRLEQ